VRERRSRFSACLVGALAIAGSATAVAQADAPAVDVTNPPAGPGVAYVVGETVVPAFTCTDADGDLAPGDCVADAPIDTSTPGTARTFTVTATDAAGETTTVTRTYDVQPVPQCDDLLDVAAVPTVPIDLSLQCTGLQDAIEIVDPPQHGTATIVDATVTYTAATGYVGDDGFTFRATHGDAGSLVAAATVHVTTPSVPPGGGPGGGGGGGASDPVDDWTPPPTAIGDESAGSTGEAVSLPPPPFLPSLFGPGSGTGTGAGAGSGNVPGFGRATGVTATRAVRNGRVLVTLRNANPFPVGARLVLRGGGPTLTRDRLALPARSSLSVTLKPTRARRARTARLTLTLSDPAGAHRATTWKLRLPAR
jgi:hypothetical protein